MADSWLPSNSNFELPKPIASTTGAPGWAAPPNLAQARATAALPPPTARPSLGSLPGVSSLPTRPPRIPTAPRTPASVSPLVVPGAAQSPVRPHGIRRPTGPIVPRRPN